VDSDKYALWELNQRSSALKTQLRVKTIEADLADWKSVNMLPEHIHLLNCNLALHYFIDTLPYIIQHSKPLIVNFVILDGSKLANSNTIYENNVIKYHYHKKEDNPAQI